MLPVVPAKAGTQDFPMDSCFYLKVRAHHKGADRILVPRMCRRLIRAGKGLVTTGKHG
jgi:hypothetical protein